MPVQEGEFDLTDELENWVAPLYIQETLPYTFAGYDEYSRPIFIVEVGKMDMRSLVEMGEETKEQVIMHVRQVVERTMKTLKEQRSEDGEEVTEVVGVVNFEGIQLRQFTASNIAFVIKLALMFRHFVAKYMGECYAVNVGFLGQKLLQLLRPILGQILDRVTVLGTNSEKWKAFIRQECGSQNLPENYGGDEDWQPVQFYGVQRE